MRLRSYRPSDLEILHQIDRACFPAAVAYSRTELASYIDHPKSQTWVAEEDGQISGFLVADRQSRWMAHVITLDVIAEWRRRGVGTLLMDAAQAWAIRAGLNLMYLETSEKNISAHQFYMQRGYDTYREIPRYYGNGVAAWVMVKYLRK